jgi:P27 family predicted phage terminase small subunit
MGTRGPRPTPTRILALRGSWRAGRNPAEPRPPALRLTPPPWLSEEAKRVFESLVKPLEAAGLVTTADENALARYAQLSVEYVRCTTFLAQHGDVYVVRGRAGPGGEPGKPVGFRMYPQAKRQLVLSAELLRLEREFGMTPASRAHLTAGVGVEGVVDVDADPDDYFTPPAWRSR